MTTRTLLSRSAADTNPAFQSFDRLFNDLWGGFARPVAQPTRVAAYRPRVDFVETEREFRVSAEVPGMEEADIDVALEDGVLTISGERGLDAVSDEEVVTRRHFESVRGRFERSLRLPTEVDADAVKAVYRAGVLTVTLPKAPEAQPRNIPISS